MRFVQRLCLAAALATPFVPAPALAGCNPLEFLFGACPAAPAASARPAASGAARHGAIRTATIHGKRKGHGDKISARQIVLAPPPGVAFASVEHFAADATLRSGDVVVTAQGFRVFRSTEQAFARLDDRKKELLALEQASLSPRDAWQAPAWQAPALRAPIRRQVERHALARAIAEPGDR
jgi:hypothetical protein